MSSVYDNILHEKEIEQNTTDRNYYLNYITINYVRNKKKNNIVLHCSNEHFCLVYGIRQRNYESNGSPNISFISRKEFQKEIFLTGLVIFRDIRANMFFFR